jgi:hypothetical protein
VRILFEIENAALLKTLTEGEKNLISLKGLIGNRTTF